MYRELLQKATLYALLAQFDRDLADEARRGGCEHCGGPLHDGRYERKPRGGPKLPDTYCERLSLCCGRRDCRRRTLPPSCLFFGRRVYWGVVVLVVTALRQRRVDGSAGRRVRAFLGVPRRTLERWLVWFEEVFPTTALWRRVRGRIGADVHDGELPSSLLTAFERAWTELQESVVACLRLLADGTR